jgi:hypothetical protein
MTKRNIRERITDPIFISGSCFLLLTRALGCHQGVYGDILIHKHLMNKFQYRTELKTMYVKQNAINQFTISILCDSATALMKFLYTFRSLICKSSTLKLSYKHRS